MPWTLLTPALTTRWPAAAAGVEISIITDHPVLPVNFLVHQCTLADMVLWSGDPLDVMQRALTVWIGGMQVYAYDGEARAGVVAPR